MLRSLLTRAHQGHRTIAWPSGPLPELPARFRGRPEIDPALCPEGCRACVEACPTQAIVPVEAPGHDRPSLRVDLGRCLFCTDCVEACPEGAIRHLRDHRLAARRREELVVDAGTPAGGPLSPETPVRALDERMRALLGRSLRLRQVSAGGCNGCEADAAVLGTIIFDMARFGIQFVASPRHADGLLVTGPVTRHMSEALRKTWDAVPAPKIVIAVGACAISGGPFAGQAEVQDGAGSLLPVDLYVPGCPPHPLTLLDGLLGLLGRLKRSESPEEA